MPPIDLSKPSGLFRGTTARGLSAGAAKEPAIDRDGGDKSAGLLRGFSMISRGEALGHDMWIDGEFLNQVNGATNQEPGGLKARFTHPGLSGDGLGKFLGRAKQARVDGDLVRADLHIDPTTRTAPDGDLAAYVLDLAESDPAAFGASIAFDYDGPAMVAFVLAHGGEWASDGYGGRYLDLTKFRSPDPKNTKQLPHVRLSKLRAVDVVDSPAANPEGLFHRGDEIAAEADSLLSFALGLTDVVPALTQLNIDPMRVKGFVPRYLHAHGLKLSPASVESDEMTDPKLSDAAKPDEVKPAELSAAPADVKPVEVAPVKPAELAAVPVAQVVAPAPDRKTEGAKFLSAFGEQGGKWFAEGLDFAAAEAQFNAEIRAENARLKAENAELSAKVKAGRGEEAPVSFSTPDGEPAVNAGQAAAIGPAAAKFASSIKLPGAK